MTKHMKYGAVIVNRSGDGKWLLFEQTITGSAIDTIGLSEKLLEDTWFKLRDKGVRLVRLSIKDGKPCDLMFEFGNNDPSVTDIMKYSPSYQSGVETGSSIVAT